MHYVLKERIVDTLLADARGLKREFYRAQEAGMTLDQNNFGKPAEEGGSPLISATTGSVVYGNSGIRYDTVPVPGSGDGTVDSTEAQAVTRVHYKTTAHGVNIDEANTWTDQSAYGDIEFKVFETAPYLVLASVSLEADDVTGFNPFRADLGVKLDGRILEPFSTIGVGTASPVGGGINIKAPIFWSGSVVLGPGEHRLVATIRQRVGDDVIVRDVKIAAIGFVR